MATAAPVQFDLNLEEIPVTLKTKDGTLRECVLKEMDGFHRDTYLNTQRGKVETNSRNLKDFLDVQTSLIGQCLFDVGTNKQVESKDIREFPSRVQMELYNLCMKLCGFDVKAEEEAKNF